MPIVPTVRPNGGRIQQIRLSKGLSRRQLAKLAGGRAESTIGAIENGGMEVAGALLVSQIARALGVDVSEITADGAAGDGEPVSAAGGRAA